jgi:hypothetical protein
VWWVWTPPTNGIATLTVERGGFSFTLLGVYVGSALTNLSWLGGRIYNVAEPVTFVANAGTFYYIYVDGNEGDIFIDLTLAPRASATNDSFATRVNLGSSNVVVEAANFGATHESGEPMHGFEGRHSVWWTWTAPANGQVNFSIQASNGFRPCWRLYVGSTITQLVERATSFVSQGNSTASGSVLVNAGTVLQIAIDGPVEFAGHDVGDFSFALSFSPAPTVPPNDNFSNRVTITGESASVTADTRLATRESGEPNHWDYSGGHSVWWTWTAPASGRLKLDAAGSSVVTLLGVYTGDAVSNLVHVASANGTFAPVEFNCQAGVTYQIAADHWYSEISGPIVVNLLFTTLRFTAPTNDQTFHSPASITLEVEPSSWDEEFTQIAFWNDGLLLGYVTNAPYIFEWNSPPLGNHGVQARIVSPGGITRIATAIFHVRPANDDFEDSALIDGESTTVFFNGANASLQEGEPRHGPVSYASVWWTWTAPAAGIVQLSKSADVFNSYMLMAVYKGSLPDLVLVTNTPATLSGTTASNIRFECRRGTTYHIAMAGPDWALANQWFQFQLQRRLANDDFADRLLIEETSIVFDASNVLGTREPDEPAHGTETNGASVWWEWIAPASGKVSLRAWAAYGANPILDVFTGDVLTNLVLVTNSVAGELSFDAEEGTHYIIAEVGAGGGTGALNFELILRTVTLIEPLSGARFLSSETVPLVAETTAGVDAVTFFANGQPIATNSGPMFVASWIPESVGEIVLTASAHHVNGVTTTSAPVAVNIAAPNDYFSNSVTVVGFPISGIGNNYAASLEPGEPDHNDAQRSLW